MKNKELQIVDFSQGIRSIEIDHNFKAVQNQINDERADVAGSGISEGFAFSVNDFNLSIESGAVVVSTGEKVYIDKFSTKIEKPILINKIEKLKTVDEFGRIYLENIPYATNRMETSDQLIEDEDTSSEENTGVYVTVSGMAGEMARVPIGNIESNVLTVGESSTITKNTKIDINYNYTYKRRDIVFINKNYEIEYRMGLTSPSPSVPTLNEKDVLHVLGYVEIDSFNKAEFNKIKAKAFVVKEFSSVRNVYTDKNNKLYLCGTPFDSIKIIHMVEPEDPSEGTLWYDMYSNKLNIWRYTDDFSFSDSLEFTGSNPTGKFVVKTGIEYLCNQNQLSVYVNNSKLKESEVIEGYDFSLEQRKSGIVYSKEFAITKPLVKGDKISYTIDRFDGFSEWVAVNDSGFTTIKEVFLWTPEIMQNYVLDKEFDKQHFFFDSKTMRNMLFTPNRNSVEILIDQIPLHSDQFDEITIADAIAGENSQEIKSKLEKHYGYTGDFSIENMNKDYENIGIGFKLNAALLKNSYVEVRVSHNVKSNPLSKRFQRSATFIEDGSFEYKEYIETDEGMQKNEPIFKTSANFRYKECQLEVFLNGTKLIRGKGFIEIASSSDLIGKSINEFKIIDEDLKEGDFIEYKVTTSVFSYDHLSSLFESYEDRLSKMDKKIEDSTENIDRATRDIAKKIEYVDNQIESLKNIENSMDDKFMKKDGIIGKENLDQSLYSGIVEESFYKTIQVEDVRPSINITGVCSEKDFLSVVNMSQSGGNKTLRRGIEYQVLTNNGQTILNIETESVEIGNSLYLSGIKLRRV